MKLDLTQTKIVGLTMELDLKTREYKKLCKKLEEYKKRNIDPNNKKMEELFKEFQKNHEKIKDIKQKLCSLNCNKEIENNDENY
ncbi:MAG: hypothetical protein IJH39_08540 [Clostridia bacterium]|nr:hypothetical protein [Clostridia bacterium]